MASTANHHTDSLSCHATQTPGSSSSWQTCLKLHLQKRPQVSQESVSILRLTIEMDLLGQGTFRHGATFLLQMLLCCVFPWQHPGFSPLGFP